MRNLKKILAMVLALVMSLSLMATAGAAQFPDVDDSNPYKTAIDVLDELKVFQGFEDGTFKPTDTLNRAQAAVLVYRIATGDVENKYLDNYTYMQQSKFADLDGYNWAKGYINYCQNAGIVVGTSATTFNPGAPVTGYQLMVMLLRTLGYGKAGEFTDPKGWELQTAAIAEREGILKNVTGGDFGAPAPRQMVAEILFRGLLHETMQYSPLTPDGYTKSGETLGKRVGLSEVEGVVMANELASLLDNDVLAEGKTQLDDYLIDYTTDFDDIGERKLAYLKDGKTVLSIEDSSKNTREFTLDASSLKDLLKKASLNAGDAEHFINFAEVDKYTTPYRIRYVLQVEDDGTGTKVLVGSDNVAQDVADSIKAANGAAVVEYNDATDDEISVVLKPKSEVSRVDLKWMEYIFADGDLSDAYEVGEIYVNTQSTKDISDDPDYYYEKFVETFLTYDDNKTTIDGNEKGNWLKVIDNDADGKADYVLKVIYTGAQVERIKNDKITLDVKNHALASHDRLSDGVRDNEVNTLTSQTVVNMSDEALEEGDVVYYAIIDGVARAYKAEMVTATIDKINRNTKSTTTTDGDEYFESAVCNHILDPEYMDEVTDLVGKVSFDLYFDRGGWLLTFIKSNRAGDFKLITDGWFNSTKTGDEYAARVYNDEEGKQEIVDLTSGGSKFIGRDVVYVDGKGVAHTTDNNDWDALKYFGATADIAANSSALDNNMAGAPDYDPDQIQAGKTPADLNGGYVTDTNVLHNRIKTTVASIDEEGNILPVEDYRITGRYNHLMIALGKDKIPTSAYSSGTPYVTDGDTAYDVKPEDENGAPITNVELRALNTTKYYVVWPAGSGVGVKAFTGYASAGDIVKLASNRGSKGLELVEDIYAVGTQTVRENDHRDDEYYYTADIVVVELNAAPTSARDIVLLVDDEGQVSSTGLRHVQVIEPDGSSKWIDVKNNPNLTLARDNYDKKIQPGLYFREEAGDEIYTLEWMDADDILAAECFITGQVQTVVKTGKQDYVIVNPADDVTVQNSGNVVNVDNEDTVQPIITESAKFYTLGYGVSDDKGYKKEAANLSDEDAEDYRTVLNSKVEGVEKGSAGDPALNRDFYLERDKTSYYYNDVLIRYNDKNQIVWAVSFQNTFDNKGTRDYAQWVWANVVPAAVEEEEKPEVITFTDVTVKGVEVVDGAVTISKAASDDANTAGIAFTSNADTVSVYFGGTKKTVAEASDVWTEAVGAVAAGTYQIILEKAGLDPVTKTVTVTVADAGSDASISSLKIKGIEVTSADIPTLEYGQATIRKPVVVDYDTNQTDALHIEVTTNDPNASWAVTTAGGCGVTKGKRDALTVGANKNVVITVTAEDGTTTAVYTLANLTVEDAPLTLAGAAAYTNSKYKIGGLPEAGTTLDTTTAKVGYTKDITIIAAADTPASNEVTEVSYTIAGSAEVVLGTKAGTYTIEAAKLAGKTGAIVVTVTETAFGLTAKASAATVTGGSKIKIVGGNGTALNTTGEGVSNRTDLVFTVDASDNAHYVSKVTYNIDGAGAETIEAVDGKYTISAEKLEDAAEVEINVTEESLIVVTNKTGAAVVIAVNDAAEGESVAVDGTISIMPGDTIKVVTAADEKPAISNNTSAVVSAPVESGTNLVWAISGIDTDGNLTLKGYFPMP